MRAWSALALFALVMLAGCADRGAANSDDDRRPTFYGGVSAGR